MYSSSQHINFIKGQTINSVISEKQNSSTFIEISVIATIEEVFDVLLAENILSVAVYRLWGGHRQQIAIVNVFDLVSFVCLQPIFDNEEVLSYDNNSYFLQKSIGELIGLTPESTNLTICNPENPLIDLLELFTRKQIHRVLVSKQHPIEDSDIDEVINQEKEQPYFVSQTDFIRFLFNHNHQLGNILDIPASNVVNKATKLFLSSTTINATESALEANISSNGQLQQQQHHQELLLDKPSSITIHDQALTAFKKIHQDGVDAVAIVNDGGSLVGEISAADLRGLNRDRLSDLKKPVIMFLKSTKGALIKPLTCHQKFTLSQVMAGIVHNKTHGAWVVDEDDIPIGVITLSDILSMFLPDAFIDNL